MKKTLLRGLLLLGLMGLLVLAVSLAALLTSRPARSLRSVTSDYLTNLQRRHYAQAYDSLCSKMRASLGQAGYARAADDSFAKAGDVTSFEVLSTTEERSGQTARVRYRLNTETGFTESEVFVVREGAWRLCGFRTVGGNLPIEPLAK